MAKKRKNKSKRPKKQSAGFMLKLKLAIVVFSLLFVSNLSYQIWHNPNLLYSPISHYFDKHSLETWEEYGDYFQHYSDGGLDPVFLASLAQAESMGNPLATTDWGLRWNLEPWRLFAPASSATGLLQITKPTWKRFRDNCRFSSSGLKKKYCDQWFGGFRIFPKHSIQMVSLDFQKHLQKIHKLSSVKKRKYLSVLHLCGPRRAERFRRGGWDWNRISRCGSHSPRRYFSKLERIRKKIKKQIELELQIAKVD